MCGLIHGLILCQPARSLTFDADSLCGVHCLGWRRGVCVRVRSLSVSDVHLHSSNLLALVKHSLLGGGCDVDRKLLFLSLLEQMLFGLWRLKNDVRGSSVTVIR